MKLEDMSDFELCQEADELLKSAGFDIWGNHRTRENYHQSRFEHSVWDGAYRNNSKRGRK